MLGRLFLALCLFNLAFNGINSIQTLFLVDKFAAQPWELGLVLVIAGITVAVVQALLVQRFVARYKEKAVAIASLFGQAVGALAVFFAPMLWLLYPLTVVNSSLSTFTFPTIGTMVSNNVSAREQGMLMGVTTALASLMTILGPLLGGLSYDHILRGAPYLFGAATFALASLVLSRQRHSETNPVAIEG